MLTVANIVITCLLWGILAFTVIHQRKKRKLGASRLVIESATYGAIEGGGVDYVVTECLQKMASNDGLTFQVLNHNFVVDGVNFVPDDPKAYKKKRLKLTYSYAGGVKHTLRRVEGEETCLVLPEDPYIEGFPLLRLEVIDMWRRLQKFGAIHRKRIEAELDASNNKSPFNALLIGSPDQRLTADYESSLKAKIVDLYLQLVVSGVGNERLMRLVYNANSCDDIEEMKGIFWAMAQNISKEDDEAARVPGRPGSPRKIR